MFNIIYPVLSIFGFLVIIAVFYRVIASRGGMGINTNLTTLVLRRFKIDSSSSDKVVIDIAGRKEGLMQWLLTIIGINPEISFKFTNDDIIFRNSSLFGEANSVVPLPSISSTHCGYSKPLGFFFFGVLFIFFGIFSGIGIAFANGALGMLIFILGIIVGVIFIVLYRLSEKIYISIQTKGGLYLGLAFKRSIIENVSIDFNQAMKVIKIINIKITGGQLENFIYESDKIICPKFGAKNAGNSKFCEKCGTPLS